MFYGNNTREVWRDAKLLGGLDELEFHRPKVKHRIYNIYNVFSRLRRDTEDGKPIKYNDIIQSIDVVNYEPDKAAEVIQAADDHYLKLCAEKFKRMNPNGR